MGLYKHGYRQGGKDAMKEIKIIYCEDCKKRTKHLKVGFGNVGGLVGNARWKCLYCKEERE